MPTRLYTRSSDPGSDWREQFPDQAASQTVFKETGAVLYGILLCYVVFHYIIFNYIIFILHYITLYYIVL